MQANILTSLKFGFTILKGVLPGHQPIKNAWFFVVDKQKIAQI